jgi:hypothetical protein
MKIDGGCYCGALRFASSGDPVFQAQCHCRECQYFSGGHPNVVMALPESGFSYTKGTPKKFRRSDLATPVSREFCADCGTQILARAPGLPGMVILKVGTLDDPTLFAGPQMAIYLVDKQPFHHVPEGVATFERTPG